MVLVVPVVSLVVVLVVPDVPLVVPVDATVVVAPVVVGMSGGVSSQSSS